MLDVCIMSPTPARRDWLVDSLKSDRSIRVAGIAATFPFLQSLMSETSTDLAIADTESQREPALVREWIQELLERVPLLLLASEWDSSILQLMLRNGSGGILETDASPEKIVQAIKSVASGLIVIDGVFGAQRSDEDSLAELLTPR